MAKIDSRKQASDRECKVRAPGCNFDPATTVLAHLNGAGMALKRHDALGAWACSNCHDFIDNRRGVASHTMRRLYHLEGMARTLEILLDEKKILLRGE